MLDFLAAFILWQNRLQTRFGHLLAWGLLSLVLLAASVVILRYGFDSGSIALQEAVIYNHAVLFMLGMAYTLQQDKHVRVDVLYSQMSERHKCWVNFLGALLFALPSLIFIAWASSDYVLNSWRIHEASAEAGGLAYVYLLKTVIWLMTALLSLQVISSIAENALKLFQNDFYLQKLAKNTPSPSADKDSDHTLEGGL